MPLDFNLGASIGPLSVSLSPAGLAVGLGLPLPIFGNNIPLVLDDIVFQAFEIPERWGPVGGEQVIAKHDFPGGIRTIQTFGAFPADLTWTGILIGGSAADRQQALDRKRATGALVTLTFGRWSYQGYVTHFEATVEHIFYIPYRIRFVPLKDLSGVATDATGNPSPEANMAQDQSALSTTTNPNTQVQPVPADVGTSVNALNTDITTGLTNSNGIVAAISFTDQAVIIAQNADVQSRAGSYIGGDNPQLASASLDAANASQAAVNTMLAVDQPIARQRYINPNLFALAQQFYGDPSLWINIANANGLYPDPQPVGEFLLLIPPA